MATLLAEPCEIPRETVAGFFAKLFFDGLTESLYIRT